MTISNYGHLEPGSWIQFFHQEKVCLPQLKGPFIIVAKALDQVAIEGFYVLSTKGILYALNVETGSLRPEKDPYYPVLPTGYEIRLFPRAAMTIALSPVLKTIENIAAIKAQRLIASSQRGWQIFNPSFKRHLVQMDIDETGIRERITYIKMQDA